MNGTGIGAVGIRTPGFESPVHDAQGVFRAVLEAMSRPTLSYGIEPAAAPPSPLGAVAGAVALTLCDAQTPLWVDDALRGEAAAWLRFHTDAPLVGDAGDAAFVLVSSPRTAPPLGGLAHGSDEEPHRSATLIIDAGGGEAGVPGAGTSLIASGPGVNGTVRWDGAGLPPLHGEGGFLSAWRGNHAAFPRGVDVILAGDRSVRALPRTTRLDEGEAR